MKLFFGGGSLAGLMKPYFWQKVGIKSLIRNTLKQNILCKCWIVASASFIIASRLNELMCLNG